MCPFCCQLVLPLVAHNIHVLHLVFSLSWMLLRDRALTFVQHAIHCRTDAEGGVVLAASTLVTRIGLCIPTLQQKCPVEWSAC